MSLDGAFRVILSGLSSVGLDAAEVCAAARLDPRTPVDPTLPFGGAALARVLERAEAMSGDPLLGLHVAERTPVRGVLSYVARSQATVGDGLRAFERFAAGAWGAGEVVRVEHRGARAFVHFALDARLPRHAVEFLVARTAILLRRSRAGAEEVWFRHGRGGDLAEYERVLRCGVRFRQPAVRLALQAGDLDRPLRTANPEAAAALAAGLGKPPAPATTVAARLAAAVEAALARGQRAEREPLARALGMSGRTLARRLALEQQPCNAVVDDVRRVAAERLIAEPGLDIGEIAARIGFADQAGFGKAFRRWFGMSPTVYRSRLKR